MTILLFSKRDKNLNTFVSMSEIRKHAWPLMWHAKRQLKHGNNMIMLRSKSCKTPTCLFLRANTQTCLTQCNKKHIVGRCPHDSAICLYRTCRTRTQTEGIFQWCVFPCQSKNNNKYLIIPWFALF